MTRINEFNVEDIIALFLPYHETLHFANMLSILHIKCVQPFTDIACQFEKKTFVEKIPPGASSCHSNQRLNLYQGFRWSLKC